MKKILRKTKEFLSPEKVMVAKLFSFWKWSLFRGHVNFLGVNIILG